ncbi:MAG TPA: class 1 fructose-bisphosphatase [Acidobacteriota bacterium]
MRPTIGTRLHRFIFEQEQQHPGASGELSLLLSQLGLAGKRIARALSRAGLMDILGTTGEVNVQGEVQQKLDAIANEIFLDSFAFGQLVPVVVTEEMEAPARLAENRGKYVVFLDPLDGSSNLDVAGAVGSIFSVRMLHGDRGYQEGEPILQRVSSEQVAAGYFLYGHNTVLVYSCGEGTHGFTLDPGIGEFLLSNPFLQIPKRGAYYAANEGTIEQWEDGARAAIRHLQQPDAATGRPYSTRYSGCLVADFHRILLKGGIYLYPATRKAPLGKLRLLYECAPLALLAERAGGKASTGRERILDLVPQEHHQRVPLLIGSEEDVAQAESFYRE